MTKRTNYLLATNFLLIVWLIYCCWNVDIYTNSAVWLFIKVILFSITLIATAVGMILMAHRYFDAILRVAPAVNGAFCIACAINRTCLYGLETLGMLISVILITGALVFFAYAPDIIIKEEKIGKFPRELLYKSLIPIAFLTLVQSLNFESLSNGAKFGFDLEISIFTVALLVLVVLNHLKGLFRPLYLISSIAAFQIAFIDTMIERVLASYGYLHVPGLIYYDLSLLLIFIIGVAYCVFAYSSIGNRIFGLGRKYE